MSTSAATAVLAAVDSTTLDDDVVALLDRAASLVDSRDFVSAFRLLGTPLSALWSEARASGGSERVRSLCHGHRLRTMTQQDPYTQRATTKPRGYAGDAVMMDFIYDGMPPPGTSELGRDIFSATTRVSMGLSVRYRRDLLRSLIDETVVSTPAARLLSVAAGHARELAGSMVEQALFSGEFVALDQDPQSCEQIRRAQAGRRVSVVTQGVRELLAEGGGAVSLGDFDLIYSAGLYDYLPDAVALRLTAQLLTMLRPGGRLVIGNFVPGGSGRGYMELFMDWPLVLRDLPSVRALGREAGARQIETFLDPHRNVAYADLSMSV